MRWPDVPFGDLCNLVNGKAFQQSDWSSEGIPIIRIQNLNSGSGPFNFWNGPLDRQVVVASDDVLLAWSGTPGTSFGAHIWHGGRAVLNQHIFRVELDLNRITKPWAVRAVNFNLIRLIEIAHGGVGLKHVTRGMVESLKIPLPPIDQQRRIAAILEKADLLRAKRRAVVAKLSSLGQSIFLDMFGDPVRNPKGWTRCRLRDCASRIQIGPFGSLLHEADYVSGGIPLINPMHITEGKLSPSMNYSIGPQKYQELGLYHLRSGDVVMGRRGEMGRCAIVTPPQDGFVCGTGSLFITPDQRKTTATYLRALLSSFAIRKKLEGLALGATLPNLNSGIVEGLMIPLPPLPVQEEFRRRLSRCEYLTSKMAASVRQLDFLFASLQHRAFHGDLWPGALTPANV